ncbi:MAG: helix-hairpin-helix domain-containing protein [Fusobacteriaceae bacterium]|jgi:competence protein ComEA|nr:helix-hairpin-helix domain-containing protein [Fusobacteriaceae bacterium]
MKKKIVGILGVFFLIGGLAAGTADTDHPFRIVESKNMKEQAARGKEEKMDINRVTKEEMTAKKIPMNAVRGILSYRETTGGFSSLSELKRIKGIGPASYDKIAGAFRIGEPVRKNRFNINKANESVLLSYGLTKKEIGAISAWKGKHGRIRNNIDLKDILSAARYEELKELIRYEDYE